MGVALRRRPSTDAEKDLQLALVLQIILAIVLLVGLITILMSAKTWHWAQMLLLLGVFLFSITTLLLGLEVVRIHSSLKVAVQKKQDQLDTVDAQLLALRLGTRDSQLINQVFTGPDGVPFDQEAEIGMPSLSTWNHRLQMLARNRGRVWRGVTKAGNVDPDTNQIQAVLSETGPAGIEQDAIVYAFEMGEPNGADPTQGNQYLGAFRVVAAEGRNVTLQAVHPLDNRTGNRLVQSQVPWSLYETMPSDRHELFANMSEEQKRAWLPESSLEEYLRHGGEPTPDDDEFHVAYFNEEGERLGPDSVAEKGADTLEKRFDRPLRDYEFMFEELARQKAVADSQRTALQEDIAQLDSAQENAEKLTEYRKQQKTMLTEDLVRLGRDLAAITAHLNDVMSQLTTATDLLAQKMNENSQLVVQLSQ